MALTDFSSTELPREGTPPAGGSTGIPPCAYDSGETEWQAIECDDGNLIVAPKLGEGSATRVLLSAAVGTDPNQEDTSITVASGYALYIDTWFAQAPNPSNSSGTHYWQWEINGAVWPIVWSAAYNKECYVMNGIPVNSDTSALVAGAAETDVPTLAAVAPKLVANDSSHLVLRYTNDTDASLTTNRYYYISGVLRRA